MSFLRKEDALRRTVTSRRMLHAGGAVSPGSYSRRAKNIISSAALIFRITKEVPANMSACALADHCVPEGKPQLAGQMSPDGKPYVPCGPEQRVQRIQNAWTCAKQNLGRTGGAAAARRVPTGRRTRQDILRELGL